MGFPRNLPHILKYIVDISGGHLLGTSIGGSALGLESSRGWVLAVGWVLELLSEGWVLAVGWVLELLSVGWVLELLSIGWVLELLSIGWVLEFLIEEGVEFNVGSA